MKNSAFFREPEEGYFWGSPHLHLEKFRYVEGEFIPLHEVIADPAAQTPEEIMAQKELYGPARKQLREQAAELLKRDGFSWPRRQALRHLVKGGSLKGMEEVYRRCIEKEARRLSSSNGNGQHRPLRIIVRNGN